MTLKKKEKVNLQIWDTCMLLEFINQWHSWIGTLQIHNKRVITRYYGLRKDYRYYRRTVGALIVYDITNDRSFENADKWLEELKY